MEEIWFRFCCLVVQWLIVPGKGDSMTFAAVMKLSCEAGKCTSGGDAKRCLGR